MTNSGVRRRRAMITAILAIAMTGLQQATPARSAPECDPNDRPEPALQGQVPQSERLSGEAADGYRCNLDIVGELRSVASANFETYQNCAYYSDNGSGLRDAGVIVLDVSDPTHPVQTAYLTSRAMRWPGESLRVNQARGLLVADHYSPIGQPTPFFSADGTPEGPENHRALAVYDVSKDCAHPKLLADVIMPSAYGHEGCFQPDGMIYYMSAVTITPIDLTDPANPKQLSVPWQPSVPLPAFFHGCSISDDGTRGYFTDAHNNQMLVVDTTAIQARRTGAQPRVIGMFPTPFELEQSTVPLSYGGRLHVLLFSEAKYPPKVCVPGQPNFGYQRIIDVSDEQHPVEVSAIQTEVVRPENCAKVAADASLELRGVEKGDPFNIFITGLFGYDSHYCTPDRLHDPTIVACAQLGSGLRVYDIRDPRSPEEVAYYNTGTLSRGDPTLDWAQARPVIRRDLGQVWWVTWFGGFHVAQFRAGVWPFPGDEPCPPGYDYFRAQYDLVYQACKKGSGHGPDRFSREAA